MEEAGLKPQAAMGERIRANSWMSAADQNGRAREAVEDGTSCATPDKFRDYSALKSILNDLYGNVRRANRFNANYAMEDLGKPIDHKKWGMNPQTVNAYNGGGENKIVFPAGILQAPFFDAAADDAVNYGAIGAVIGHEISHGFDDQGRKIDATGAVKDWWTAEDNRRFEAEAKVFGEQYAKFEAVPGAFLNPALTMGENIADFAGVQVALDAYHRSLGGKPGRCSMASLATNASFSPTPRCGAKKQREDAMRSQVTTDRQQPGPVRVLGPLRNVDAWYDALQDRPGFQILPAARKARADLVASASAPGRGLFCVDWLERVELSEGNPAD